ncbi:uncharacterized protein LOC143855983 [Tasmannia lanceolata]|uniref:uncharacterized protein LOC143855983 n=1 Tax=Tasmannia lanceolata TaxID=3420 RepID=UPI004062EB00
MGEIIDYLCSGKLPEGKKEARKVIQRAARFSLDGENLYKRSSTIPYLKCLRPSDAVYTLQETHEGICGEHLRGQDPGHQSAFKRPYWPTLRRDALDLVKKCERCQKFSPIIHQPAVSMAPIISPLPFAVWGMDILGPFPKASGRREFVVVAIDYFTKWVEAEPLAQIIEQNRFTSVAHPQTNRQTEVTNRILLQGIKKRLDEKAGRWADELYHVLWAYRTTPRTTTREVALQLALWN